MPLHHLALALEAAGAAPAAGAAGAAARGGAAQPVNMVTATANLRTNFLFMNFSPSVTETKSQFSLDGVDAIHECQIPALKSFAFSMKLFFCASESEFFELLAKIQVWARFP
jgi:hypothetical protein